MERTFKHHFIMLFLSINLIATSLFDIYAQNNNDFTRISINDGLSQSTVRTILQDSEGYMWFGTQDGLNKYDGYNFTIYKNDLNNDNSLANNDITSLVEDGEGNIWIGTNGGGLDKFNKESEIFSHFKASKVDVNSVTNNFIFSLYIDSSGLLWIGTVRGGLNIMNIQSGKIKNVNTVYSQLENTEVLAINEDKKGDIWLGTNIGLYKVIKATSEVIEYKLNNDNSISLNSRDVHSIFKDRSGDLWIGSYGGGLSKYDYENDKLIQHQKSTPTKKFQQDLEYITGITEDENGNLWFSTWGNGIKKFNKKTNEFIRYINDPDNPESLSYNTIWTIYIDKSNLLWIGTYGTGLNKLVLSKNKFKGYKSEVNNPNSISSNSVRGIYEDKDGVLWVGGYGGLNKINRKTNKIKHFIGDKNIHIGSTYSILPDNENTDLLWIGTEGGGLYKFNKKTEIFTSVYSSELDVTHIFSIQDDKEGNLWLGAQSGFYQFNKKTLKYSEVFRDASARGILLKSYVTVIYIDSKGVIWVGTNGKGLIKFNKNTREFITYLYNSENPFSINNSAIKSIYEDSNGVFWIGTDGGGINKFNVVSEQFTHYTENDGLPNNVVYGILEDNDQNLWLSTNKGISKFDKRNIVFKNFTVEDGLQSNEFNTASYFKSNSGELFFGGVEGLNSFFPSQIKINKHIPPIVITKFKTYGKELNFQEILSSNKEVELTYKDNYISFEFAALDYNSSDQNQYAFKLEGFDDNWIYSGTRRFTSYTNLEGGNYVFRVKGTNNDGVWNETGAAIPIYVKPPFRKTIWFVVLCGLSLIIIVYVVFKIRLNQVRLKTKNQYLKNQNEEKIALLKEVHHRMKNNLQMVNSLLKFQSREIEDEKIVDMFKDAQNRVLSMSLLHEKMYNSIDLQHVDIEEHLTLLIKDLVKSYAFEKEINLNIQIEKVDFEIQTLVPLGLIINEMITNSLKYAFKDRNMGTITVHLKQLDTKLQELIIGDDGEGYAPEKKHEGLGTKLIQIFAKQLNGTMTKLDQSGTFYKLVFEKID